MVNVSHLLRVVAVKRLLVSQMVTMVRWKMLSRQS